MPRRVGSIGADGRRGIDARGFPPSPHERAGGAAAAWVWAKLAKGVAMDGCRGIGLIAV